MEVSTYAGVAPGRKDAKTSKARFWEPAGIAVTSKGTVYVADQGNYTIRKITSSGKVTTFAGKPGVWGNQNGSAATALLGPVSAMTVDAAGNLYICDWNTIRVVDANGAVSPLPGLMQNFQSTDGIARDRSGNLYVSDRQDCTIWKISKSGVATKIAGVSGERGHADGAAKTSKFNLPGHLAVDSKGNVYVVDSENYVIRKITPSGRVSTLAGKVGEEGDKDGKGTKARFSAPSGIAIDSSNNLYVSDSNKIRRIKSDGKVTTLSGAESSGFANGSAKKARFCDPSALAVGSGGVIYVSDTGNHTIRKLKKTGTASTLAGKASPGLTDGSGTSARFYAPAGLARDAKGNLFVADKLNNAIRKISSKGKVSTVAGSTKGAGGYKDGKATSARFSWPMDVAVASDGTLYVADTANNVIRRITTKGVVETFAGSPDGGSSNGTGKKASFFSPRGLALDKKGNLFVADQENHTIRKITPKGKVTTFAGKAGQAGLKNGKGSAARFSWPEALAIDSKGNLYVSEQNDTIRKIAPSGKVTTFAGAASSGSIDGKKTKARFRSPAGLAVDAADNVYVADYGNNLLRVITPAGKVTTLAGYAGRNGYGASEAGSAGYLNGAGADARLNGPWGIAVAPDGKIYFTDYYSNTVRTATPVKK